jgi:hypothetical protein
MRSHPSVVHASLLAAVVAACTSGRASGSDKDASADTGAAPSALTDVPSSPPAPSEGPPAGSSPTAKTKPVDPAEAEDQAEMRLLKLTLAPGVRDKEPVSKLEAAKPGQRVWAHVTLRNRTGFAREIDLVFRVGGKERSRVTLNVEASWSFRTWGYVTLRPADVSGDVSVTVVSDSGEELGSAKIPIKP